MSFSIKAMCKHGELAHRRKTAEAAPRKAREMSRAAAMTSISSRPKDGTTTHLSSQTCLVCQSAWGPDADRRAKRLI
jgi:hypothetical protein